MKINDIKIPALSELKRPEKVVKKESSEQVSGSKDMINISPKALEFQEAIDAAKAAPEIRSDKVQLLKDEISKGMYRVRSGNVADKIIESALEK